MPKVCATDAWRRERLDKDDTMIKKALCIGNVAYTEQTLANPTNDARDVAGQLKALGFECIELADATIANIQEALKRFSENLHDAEVGLFFFAGHGMQIDGDNYLTAFNTDFENELDAKYSCLPLNQVIETLERGENPTSIIACTLTAKIDALSSLAFFCR